MALFVPQTESVIIESLMRDRWMSKRADREQFEKFQAFYKGGSALATYLVKHTDEDDAEYADRQARFASLNFLRRVAEEVQNAVYGGDVEILLPGTPDKQSEAFQEVYNSAGIRTVRTVLGNSLAVNGGAWANPSYSEQLGRIVIQAVPPQCMDYETHKDDTWALAAVDESRVVVSENGGEKTQHWVWWGPGIVDGYPDGFGVLLDENGNVLDTRFVERPYGVIPYVYMRGLPVAGLFEGLSYIRDTQTIQHALNNDLSDARETIELQGFGQPYTDATDPRSKDEKGAMRASPRRVLFLNQTGATFGFASPNAPINDVLGYLDRMVDWMAETASIPVDAVRVMGGAESGRALLIKWRPFYSLAMAQRQRCAEAEAQLVRVVCKIAEVEGVKGLPKAETLYGDKAPRIKFLEPIVPGDEAMERAQDQLDVEAERMLLTDYLTKYRDGINTEGEAKDYIAKLEESKAQKKANEPEPQQSPFDFGGGGVNL